MASLLTGADFARQFCSASLLVKIQNRAQSAPVKGDASGPAVTTLVLESKMFEI